LELHSELPTSTPVTWVGRPFDRKWKHESQATASGTIAVDNLVKKPGSYLLVVTTEPVAAVDELLDQLQLPIDVGSHGLEAATGAVAAALSQHGTPPGMIFAVCELLL